MTNNTEIKQLMNNPTSTTNKLHFDDLSWQRFEDLVFEIVYRKCKWKEIASIGQKGKDGGVDIMGVDNEGTTWYIQCKNHQSFSKAEAQAAIDKIVDNYEIAKDSMLLIVVACGITSETFQFIKSYSMENGFKESYVLVGSNLEALLYNDYMDLLYKFFGIETEHNRNKEKVLQGNKMRQEVQRKLLRDVEWNHETRMVIARDPSKLFRYEKVVIRSVDDVDDPYGENASYCVICPYQLTEVGIELLDYFWDDYRIAINVDTRCWRRIKDDDNLMENEFDIRADHIVLLPYYSIIKVLDEVDDRFGYPVLMCNFEFNQTPFLRRYYKHRPSKADFIEGKPLSPSDFTLLIDEVEKETSKNTVTE